MTMAGSTASWNDGATMLRNRSFNRCYASIFIGYTYAYTIHMRIHMHIHIHIPTHTYKYILYSYVCIYKYVYAYLHLWINSCLIPTLSEKVRLAPKIIPQSFCQKTLAVDSCRELVRTKARWFCPDPAHDCMRHGRYLSPFQHRQHCSLFWGWFCFNIEILLHLVESLSHHFHYLK